MAPQIHQVGGQNPSRCGPQFSKIDVLGGWGPLGGLLGGLEAVLDRSWAALIGHGSSRVILEPAGPAAAVPLEGPRGAKMTPKLDSRRTKIADKNEDEERRS